MPSLLPLLVAQWNLHLHANLRDSSKVKEAENPESHEFYKHGSCLQQKWSLVILDKINNASSISQQDSETLLSKLYANMLYYVDHHSLYTYTESNTIEAVCYTITGHIAGQHSIGRWRLCLCYVNVLSKCNWRFRVFIIAYTVEHTQKIPAAFMMNTLSIPCSLFSHFPPP